MVGECELAIIQHQLMEGIFASYPRWVIHHNAPLPALQDISMTIDDEITHPMPYQLVIGSLTYLVRRSFPDTAFSINSLAQNSMKPTKKHWAHLDHLIFYLARTQDSVLMLCPKSLSLNLWRNAGWGGKLEFSQSCFLLKLGNTPMLWASRQQEVVSLSACAAEYVSISNLTQKPVQAINQLLQLVVQFKKYIFCENQVVLQISIYNLSQKWMQCLDCAFFHQQHYQETQHQGTRREGTGHAGQHPNKVALRANPDGSTTFSRDQRGKC
ncbi:hypothetical protein O181_056539 [Austropuccinia psidii MF-1]|uniref:Reverse transcriptase Ty1/copia-type domain-containing protein n=1 Tax=Austropuccinia psidii MF-1 TaxID=1389203 RepID=A0A9Q3E8N1_9BASI|nr:hypothetical protein [Austropuccinia psidii MF-1]